MNLLTQFSVLKFFSAAKLGLVGLTKTCAAEGERSGILCNVIVPMAASRLTEDILPPGLDDLIYKCILGKKVLLLKKFAKGLCIMTIEHVLR